MAQRIIRAKRTVLRASGFTDPGDSRRCCAGSTFSSTRLLRERDLAAESIRSRAICVQADHQEVVGIARPMLLHHARRPARTAPTACSCLSPSSDRTHGPRLIAEGSTGSSGPRLRPSR